MKLLFYFLIIFQFLTLPARAQISTQQFIVWNVGQGQWTTLIEDSVCIHFDMGGEKNVISSVEPLCRFKTNIIHLSHWDWDHLSFAVNYFKKLPNSCLWQKPLGKTSEKRQQTFEKINLCPKLLRGKFNKIDFKNIFSPSANLKHTNDRSLILTAVSSHILIPGDSPTKQEAIWAKQNNQLNNIYGLVLGHHGSRTSTSNFLLLHLPHLKWAVASARKEKYGHPHIEVINRLKEHKIPLLKTEDWGNIHFLLND